MASTACAGKPLWNLDPLTATTIEISPTGTAIVQYLVTNQSKNPHTLAMLPIQGVTQITTGSGICANPFMLPTKGSSCILSLRINGAQLTKPINDGPVVCQGGNPNQCYRPNAEDVLRITKSQTIAIGQPFGGGVVACLNGGLNNLIAATADNPASPIQWGVLGTAVGAGAQSPTDGASNTVAIVATLTALGVPINTYAAGICSTYQVDSQGNTPCQPGNACYNDWFLPAGNNLTATGQLNCLFTNRVAIGGFASGDYWSSTEFSGIPTSSAWVQNFGNGSQNVDFKSDNLRVRCVRAFTP
ncbi:TPA: DUF1566 domain-containing protein [Legionella pneumophila]|nr:DUF1566 domain-containing protein [Legionella pneumophila]HCJ1110085.1 DUF1566 domain-containing protein [Legionella pneumophila]HCJ1113359.1 DUF1566 domain-containing protein [Legionella pneumophila]HCU6012561.1 DUF1566 domain-containing protein [Legionella pneumophila]